jgi:hypothetical protein
MELLYVWKQRLGWYNPKSRNIKGGWPLPAERKTWDRFSPRALRMSTVLLML